MSLAHLHLLLNHVPVVGIFGLLLLLGIAFVRRSDELNKVSLWLLVLLGATSAIVFFTGEPAEELVEDIAGISKASLERHEDIAKLATLAMTTLAVVALGVLLYFRRRVLPRWLMTGALVASAAASVVMGITANLGGQIRHSEIRAGGAEQLQRESSETREAAER